MKYTIYPESFHSIYSFWEKSLPALRWNSIFVLPSWLKVWWRQFGADSVLYLCSVRQSENIIGIAPLSVTGKKAAFIGSTDVCDYLDFVVTPGKEEYFFTALIEHLKAQGISYLDLRTVRPDSTVCTHLVGVARRRGADVSLAPEDVTLELDLPAGWDEYLRSLNGKQRHEIRRKIRRLREAGDIDYRVVQDTETVKQEMDTFLALFRLNRSNKAEFMTDRMGLFFRSFAAAMAETNILRLCFLDFDSRPVAALICFDYNSTICLYNSAYDSRFSSLSVGVLSKVLSIKDSIQNGRKKYDFLKGDEAYKHRLGGSEVPLYRCRIKLK